MSTHTCNLNIPWLPGIMDEAHIVPELAHASLISTQKSCNTGCKGMLNKEECRVYYKGRLVLTGGRDPATELWQLPSNPTAIHNVHMSLSHFDLVIPADALKVGMQFIHQASNVHTIPYKQNQLKYMHKSMFSPPIATLTNAINNDFLDGFPFIKKASLYKNT